MNNRRIGWILMLATILLLAATGLSAAADEAANLTPSCEIQLFQKSQPAVERITDAVIGMSFAHRDPENNRRTMCALPGVITKVNDLRRMGSAAYVAASVVLGV